MLLPNNTLFGLTQAQRYSRSPRAHSGRCAQNEVGAEETQRPDGWPSPAQGEPMSSVATASTNVFVMISVATANVFAFFSIYEKLYTYDPCVINPQLLNRVNTDTPQHASLICSLTHLMNSLTSRNQSLMACSSFPRTCTRIKMTHFCFLLFLLILAGGDARPSIQARGAASPRP